MFLSGKYSRNGDDMTKETQKTEYVAYENTLIKFNTKDGTMSWNNGKWVSFHGLTAWVIEGNRITEQEANGIIEGKSYIDENDLVVKND